MEADEGELRREFQRRSGQLPLEREPGNEWEWYFLMQHYRAPTRLLDWTDSALVALFFAVTASAPHDPAVSHDAAVWVLDPWWLNSQVLHDPSVLMPDYPVARRYLPDPDTGVLRSRWPVAIDPPYIARRVGLQRSHFTVYGRDREGLHSLSRRPRSRLVKITIPKGAVPHMRLDLNTCGLCDTLLFPDLEGLSRELTRYYADTWENELPPYRPPEAMKGTKNVISRAKRSSRRA
jgi:hypothetical protein